MNVRHDSSPSDCSLYEQVQFFVSPNRELEVTWCYTFNFEISSGVS